MARSPSDARNELFDFPSDDTVTPVKPSFADSTRGDLLMLREEGTPVKTLQDRLLEQMSEFQRRVDTFNARMAETSDADLKKRGPKFAADLTKLASHQEKVASQWQEQLDTLEKLITSFDAPRPSAGRSPLLTFLMVLVLVIVFWLGAVYASRYYRPKHVPLTF